MSYLGSGVTQAGGGESPEDPQSHGEKRCRASLGCAAFEDSVNLCDTLWCKQPLCKALPGGEKATSSGFSLSCPLQWCFAELWTPQFRECRSGWVVRPCGFSVCALHVCCRDSLGEMFCSFSVHGGGFSVRREGCSLGTCAWFCIYFFGEAPVKLFSE